ncbi:YfhO family protein [Flavobacterium sp. CAU 1735]|uniref:YfhO family protein n=1 Tax=Flavobacterium sp. CAU 1735 TaxID=3140361 RepID=UPI00326143B9
MKNLSKFYPHVLAILGFVLISLLYFHPVLQGKKVFQSDIAQYIGMAKEQTDFRKTTGQEPYWTDSAFGGMPTYQLGANYPNNFIKQLDSVIRFLPRPADYLFLYFLGFYILLRVFRVDSLKAFFGALAFGFSTYLIIILGVGHNAKAHAIAYMPMVVAGVILVFRKRYLAGGILTMLAAALEINANHFQMTYYLLLFLLVIGIYYLVQYIKNKEYKDLGIIAATFAIAGILSIGVNATNLMATSEYAKYSTRSDSELTFNPDGSKKESSNAMSYDYITEYSYGIAESFNLIAPRLFGGSNHENVGENSPMYEFISNQGASPSQAKDFVSSVPTYWGAQPIVAAPAYIGAIVFFLAVLALFVDNRKIKYAFLAGALMSLFLSWGKYFPALTNFFIDYVPMYNKFRAVSSIQVILELCMPVLAVLGLQSFFKAEEKERWNALWKSGATALGVVVILLFAKGMFDFTGGSDSMYLKAYGEMGPPFIDALKEQRAAMYVSDLLRSGVLILLAAAILWLFSKNKLSQVTAVVLVGVLMVGDLFFVDKNYVNSDSFVSARQADVPFEATPADEQILKDTTHYRVFEVEGNMSSARTSYFHSSIGGYHAAKPRKMQQLFDYQIAKNNIGVLNMLNVKYIIQKDDQGQDIPLKNAEANGNAWFVSDVKKVDTPDAEMKALDKLDTKKTAVLNQKEFVGVVKENTFVTDSTATIKLTQYEPNYLKYTANNPNKGLAVFSEVYYPKGWKATIDGKEVPHFAVNYVLRAMEVPAGKHTIEFKFEPEVIKKGSMISLISFIVMLALIIAGIYFDNKKKQQIPS